MTLIRELKQQGDFLFRHRSYLPIVIILVGLWVYWQGLRNGTETNFLSRTQFEFIGLGISLFGLLIRIITIGYAADNTSGRNTTEGQIADSINTTGSYSWCRHPLYLGNFFMWLGIAIWTMNGWFVVAFVFLYWLYYERIMFAEEQFLIEKYGDSYKEWALTKSAFIPNFTTWIKPKYSFSWVKWIRQEKAGILNLFLVFFVFNGIYRYHANQSFQWEWNFWSYAFLLSILWYLIIKIIQKSSVVLSKDRK